MPAYSALCTFELKNASEADLANAYADLENIGLRRRMVTPESVLPAMTTAGLFPGESKAALCDQLRDSIIAAFTARGFQSRVFVSVGDDWEWRLEGTGVEDSK